MVALVVFLAPLVLIPRSFALREERIPEIAEKAALTILVLAARLIFFSADAYSLDAFL